MKMTTSFALAAVAVALSATLGAGCGRSNDPVVPPNPPSEQSVLRGAIVGDTVVLEESNAVVGGKLVTGPVTRRVTLTEFSIGHLSSASWVLANASGTAMASSTWAQGALDTAHPFYLPGVFDSRNRPAADASLLWLAKQEYIEMKATSGTTINPRFSEISEWRTRTAASPGATKAFNALLTLIANANTDKVDTTYARIEGDPFLKTIRLNGKEMQVPAIRLRNWFGTYEVMDRIDNPLVLSFTLDPQVDKQRLNVTSGDGAELSKLTNYQVKEIVQVGQ